MIHHGSVGTNDLKRSKRFYDAVLPIVGIMPFSEAEDGVGYISRRKLDRLRLKAEAFIFIKVHRFGAT
jgi:hypothetical protein